VKVKSEAMASPLDLERQFQSLVETLSEPLATAQRLIRAAQFIEHLSCSTHAGDSYLIELADALPSSDVPAGYYGIDPADLRRAVHTVVQIAHQVPALAQSTSLREKLESYQLNLALAYVHVGKLDDACLVLEADEVSRWLSLYCTAPAGTARQMLNAATQEARARKQRMAEQLSYLERTYPRPVSGFSVYIPVLERASDEREEAHGVLRTVSLASLRRPAGQRDEITSNIVTYGSAQTQEGLIERPLKAARRLATEHRLPPRSSRLSSQILFDRADALHQGSSSDLALASLFACALVALADGRERLGLAEDVALTGIVDEWGDIHQVDPGALPLKVSAAFYAPVQCLVVPRTQCAEAERIRDALQERYPARTLSVIGVSHVRELFYDRRVTRRDTISLPRHLGSKLWKLRRPLAAMILLFLSALVFRLWYGPLDRNASYVESVGGVLHLYNESGSLVRTIDVGGETSLTLRTERFAGLPYLYEIADLADMDGDGSNELLWATMHGTDVPFSEVICTDVATGDERWRTPLRLAVDFPNSPDVVDDRFQPSKIRAADVNADGVPEVYVVACHMFFPSLVMQLDARTGTPLGHYLHTGHVRDLEVADLDSDGTAEILLTGVNNGFNEAFFAVLDGRALAGRSPTTVRYEPAQYPEADHLCYLRFPRTVVGEVFRLKSESGIGVDVTVDPVRRVVSVAILDVNLWSEETRERHTGIIYAWLDSSLRLKGYSSGGGYDRLYDLLRESGRIPSVDRAEYLLHEMPKPLYWTPDGWRR